MRIAFRAFRSGNQTGVVTSTVTQVQLNAESYDPSNVFDSTTNFRFTVPSGGDGYYLISGAVYWSSANARQATYIYKNGSAISSAWNDPASGTGGADASNNCTDILQLAAADTVDLRAWQETGGNGTVAGGTLLTWLTGYRLSSTQP